jgi:hypothetical protein
VDIRAGSTESKGNDGCSGHSAEVEIPTQSNKHFQHFQDS